MTIKRLLIASAALAWLGFLAVLGASYFMGLKQASAWPPPGQALADKDVAKVERNVQQLEKKMAGLLPKGLYIVIDTAENRLYLKNGAQVQFYTTMLPATVLSAQQATVEVPASLIRSAGRFPVILINPDNGGASNRLYLDVR